MPRGRATHLVAVLAFEGMASFELGVTAEVFALPRPELDVAWWYSYALCGERVGSVAAVGGFQIHVPNGLDVLAAADTVIVPGCADVHGDPSPALVSALRVAHARGARLVSICSGAFTLAGSGLLDGRPVTTHWLYTELLAARYPHVQLHPSVLYVDDGDILTSAGTASGIDLCLHLVRSDHGAAIANQVARRMVVAPQRDGGQAQFVEAPVARVLDDPIAATMSWALQRLTERISVGDMARTAHLSTRQFTRRFVAAAGTTPSQWLVEARIRASLPLLEESDAGIEEIGRLVGISTPAGFRRHFARVMGVAPSAYRRTFRARDVSRGRDTAAA